MTDMGRITDVWGDRTPYAQGTRWPERVDRYLTVDEERVERRVPSACVLCSNGCGLDIAVADDRIVGVRGHAADRVNHGRLGPKGLFGWQANNSRDRLTAHLIRVDGALRETDWDTAVDRFGKVMPKDFKRVLAAQAAAQRDGRDVNEAIMEAAHG